jgi:plasmid maintenance system killer protein
MANPRPPGLRFEKLQGYRRPDIYTIHVTGNFKISMEIEGNKEKNVGLRCANPTYKFRIDSIRFT